MRAARTWGPHTHADHPLPTCPTWSSKLHPIIIRAAAAGRCHCHTDADYLKAAATDGRLKQGNRPVLQLAMDYYPMEEQVLHQHPGFRAAQLPWQLQWQLRLFSLLSSQPELPPRRPANHVSWEETAAAHLFSASLPGVRKEEIRVEVEDGRYLVIRTELDAAPPESGARSFDRKFRLPGMVDVDGISAAYAHGVLTVTVPRMHTRARPVVGLLGAGPARDCTARAASFAIVNIGLI